jgi:zinc protease
MFKGTETLGSGEFSEVVAANGGTDNAFTSYDYTAYFQRVAADRLELMMEMEADRMVNLSLDPEDVDTERQVILEERNQRTENEPGALFGEQRNAAQYMNHPYGIPIIGWRHEMEGLSLEDAKAFYRQHYAPNNAILIVAGDVEPEEVRALAETHYGPIPANPDLQPRARPSEPPQLAERRLSFADPRVAQPYVVRTYLAPERNAGDQREAAALLLLAEVLGGSGQTSVLAQKLQFDTQVAVYTSAFYGGVSLDNTTFGLIIVPAEGVGRWTRPKRRSTRRWRSSSRTGSTTTSSNASAPRSAPRSSTRRTISSRLPAATAWRSPPVSRWPTWRPGPRS